MKPITLKNIMKFALPTIAMSLFMAFYTMVDGLFVSNLIGTNALSAINLSAPIISLVTAISTMLATGGSAVIMKKAGEKKQQEANENFTFLIVVNIVVGITMTLIGYLCMNMLFSQMDVSAEVLHHTKDYLSRYLLFTISILLMNNFSLYLIAAGKATVSFICSVAGGVLNIVLDYLFVSIFARPDNPVFELAVTGNRICSIALLFIGFNIFSSGMFTALNNGIVSAILAFSRSFVFMVICLLALPLFFGVTGIWLATPAAELMAIALACFMFLKYKNKYKF